MRVAKAERTWTAASWNPLLVGAGEVRLSAKALDAPWRWHTSRRIRVQSKGDIFHGAVEDAWIDQIVAMMWNVKWHTYEVLTRRPDRMRDYLARLDPVVLGTTLYTQVVARTPEKARYLTQPSLIDWIATHPQTFDHIWWGTSAENLAPVAAWVNETLWGEV